MNNLLTGFSVSPPLSLQSILHFPARIIFIIVRSFFHAYKKWHKRYYPGAYDPLSFFSEAGKSYNKERLTDEQPKWQC